MQTLGLEGMPRRIATYANPAWATTNMIITVSSFLIAFSVLLFFINVIRSWNGGGVARAEPPHAHHRDRGTPTPPPPHHSSQAPPPPPSPRPRHTSARHPQPRAPH